MKFSAFQPYFFPYLGHFDLINKVDKWIISDNLQYIKKGWMNRNRILHPERGWTYIVVPLKSHPYTTLIEDVVIDQSQNWQVRIMGQLAHYKNQAPYSADTFRLVEGCLSNHTDSLVELNTSILAAVCEFLGIRFDYITESDLGLRKEDTRNRDEHICGLARMIGADEYLNPPSGAHLYDFQTFRSLGVKLSFQSYTNFTYATGRYTFEPALSIIDVLMWNSRTEIKRYLDQSKNVGQNI